MSSVKTDVKIIWLDVSPAYAPEFVEMLSLTEDDVEVPATPYFNYPFTPAASITEYIVFREIMDPSMYEKYDGVAYERIEEDLQEAARLLGKKYVIYIDEGGDGSFDRVVFTNREELLREALRLAEEIDEEIVEDEDY